jgi:predicted nucleic acid-binding protein
VTFLIDSDWIIDALTSRQEALDLLSRLPSAQLSVSIITVGEVYEGAFGTSDPVRRLEDARQFLSGFEVLPLDDATMVLFAEHRAHLRALGTMIADLDLLIACTALQHDLTLVTRNLRHFGRVPGLRLHPQSAT